MLDHAAGDLIVVTQAGARLADLQAGRRPGGQRLALDETVPGASVGGTLAANASGPRRVATGTARDLLIGITVVRADGVVAKAGGTVVKNVAGYDLGKLLIGSFGTLAVVTEAVFRLHPLPGAQPLGAASPVADPARGPAARRSRCVHAQAVPAAVEVELARDGHGHASACCSRAARTASTAAPRRSARAARRGRRPSPTTTRPAGATYPWDTGGRRRRPRHRAQADLRALRPRRRARRRRARPALHVRGSAGAGVAYAALPAGTPVERRRRGRRPAARDLRRGTAAASSWSTRRPRSRQAVDVWGPVPALDLMRRVKDQFDPDHRLAPGRFVGGI